MAHDLPTQIETSKPRRPVSTLGAIVVATVAALSIGTALAQSQTGPNQSSQQPKSEEQKPNESDAGFRMGPMSRPPAMTRPMNVQRPMMQQRQISRPTMRAQERRTASKPAARKGASRSTERKGASKPEQKREQKRVSKPASNEKPINKPAEKPIGKPVSKPAAVDQPVNRPVTRTDRPQDFFGKPNSVAHNPLHNDGQLGKSGDHKPMTVEKYGQYYKRDYYSTTVDGRPSWYWFDTPLGLVPPVTNNIPVCNGDTDDCPVQPPVVLTDDKPKLTDDPKPKPDGKKEGGGTLVSIEKECPGATFAAGHAYSVCVGGTWHVQSYDTYMCPPSVFKRFKTLDEDTQQPCTNPPPTEPGGLMFPSDGGVPCGGKADDPKGGTVTLISCVNGKVTERHYKRAICQNGMYAPGTFIDEVPTDKPCTGGADWKPELPDEQDGKKIEEPKPEEQAKP